MLKTVLLVEDDESFRESMKKLLEREGMRVLEASSGEEGIEILKSDREMDLVLLDLYLNGISGLEFLDKSRALEGPPVIVVTAVGDPAIRADAVERGAVACLSKPVKKQLLMQRIQQAFGQSRN